MARAYGFKPLPDQPGPEHGARSGFHGSPKALQGDTLSGDVASTQPQHRSSSQVHVNWWSSPSGEEQRGAEKQAWSWGQPRNQGTPEEMKADPSLGRPRVHQVQAEGAIGFDANMADHITNPAATMEGSTPTAMASPSARVTSTVWIPPPRTEAMEKGIGVQGTLPHINWNQFGAPNMGNPEAAMPESQTAQDYEHERRHKMEAGMAADQARIHGSQKPKQVDLPGQGNLFA